MDNFDLKKYLDEGKLLKEDKEEPRDGVKSAAEKLGMKPSHVKEEEHAKLGPSSQFTFEPNDPKKDLMIHTIVDEYQEKIFDYLWNYELYRNEYSKDFGY